MQEDQPDRLQATHLFVTAGILGALAVALGAFGAHGLESALQGAADEAKRLEWWKTGAHYHLVHSLLAALHAQRRSAAGVFVSAAGCAFFSGSLYAMTLTNIRVLGAITPIGGLAFIAAWLLLLKKK